MLTGFTWCVRLKTKTAEEVVKAYMDHIYSNFGRSIKILTDNGMEFKNKLFKEVVKKLGTEFSIHSPPYRPQSNGKIEGFHRFLKTCIGKHINYGLEWDELTPMATACSRTAMPENQHSSLCLEETRSINLTCYYTQQGDTFTMTMDYPI